MKLVLASAVSVLLSVAVAACAETPVQSRSVAGEQSVRYGVVGAIDQIEVEGDHQLGVGAVVGAAAGGVIGHQIGSGTGRDVATVLGVLGGGFAGNTVQHNLERRPGQQILVRLDNGASITVTQVGDSQLRVGDRVVIHGDGRSAHVVRG